MICAFFALSVSGFCGSGSQVDSARMNLASSFVNGFVNAAFGQDKLLTEDGNKWLYKNKDHGNFVLHQKWKECSRITGSLVFISNFSVEYLFLILKIKRVYCVGVI